MKRIIIISLMAFLPFASQNCSGNGKKNPNEILKAIDAEQTRSGRQWLQENGRLETPKEGRKEGQNNE